MKREGRQHGMVRAYPILPAPWDPRPPPKSRTLNELTTPPTAGLFTKVPSRPTNHSKFTGKCRRVKCRGCHVHPACKAKDKAKGTQKPRSSLPWCAPEFKFSGFSASRVFKDFGSHDCEPDEDVGVESDEVCKFGADQESFVREGFEFRWR